MPRLRAVEADEKPPGGVGGCPPGSRPASSCLGSRPCVRAFCACLTARLVGGALLVGVGLRGAQAARGGSSSGAAGSGVVRPHEGHHSSGVPRHPGVQHAGRDGGDVGRRGRGVVLGGHGVGSFNVLVMRFERVASRRSRRCRTTQKAGEPDGGRMCGSQRFPGQGAGRGPRPPGQARLAG
jgi:hypothetical protein